MILGCRGHLNSCLNEVGKIVTQRVGFIAVLALLQIVVQPLASIAWANTEFPISNPIDGMVPYTVVFRDATGASQRAPGIYTATASGDVPVLQGEVLTGGISRGVLAQLELARFDHSYVSVAVVDGKVRIFNRNARASNAGSFITIGDGLMGLSDVNGLDVDMPLVERIDAISILTQSPKIIDGHYVQLVLLSVKTPGQSVLGNGLTLVLMVKALRSTGGGVELVHAPTVIDYRFHSIIELQRLTVPDNAGSYSVFSELAVKTLRRRLMPAAESFVRDWGTGIVHRFDALVRGGELPESISNTLGEAATLGSLPVWNAYRSGVDIANPPVRQHQIGLFNILQSFSHLPERASITLRGQSSSHATATSRWNFVSGSLGPSGVEPIPSTLPGTLDLFEDGKPRLYMGHQFRSIAFHADGALYFASLQNGSDVEVVKLRQAAPAESSGRPTLPRAVSLVVTEFRNPIPNEGSVTRKLMLVISEQFETGGRTTAYELRVGSSGLERTREVVINNSYYNPAELPQRLQVFSKSDHSGQSSSDRVLFDDLTDITGSVEAYSRLRRPTVPYLDLLASGRSDAPAARTYLEELDRVIVIDKKVVFRRYDIAPLLGSATPGFLPDISDQSGLYFLSATGGVDRALQGLELIQRRIPNAGLLPWLTRDLIHVGAAETRHGSRSNGGGQTQTPQALSESSVHVFSIAVRDSLRHWSGHTTGNAEVNEASGLVNDTAFKLLLVFNPTGQAAEQRLGFGAHVAELTFDRPFGSLKFLRVVQPGRSHRGQVIVLAGFEREGVNGVKVLELTSAPVHVGVHPHNGHLRVTTAAEGERVVLQVPSIDEAFLIDRLRFTSTGELVYLATPELPISDRAYAVNSLMRAGRRELLSGLGATLLSESESRRWLSGEEATGSQSLSALYNSWALMGRGDVTHRMKKITPSNGRRDELYRQWPNLEHRLERFAHEQPRHRIVLVPPERKEMLIEAVAQRLVSEQRSGEQRPHPWDIDARRVAFSWIGGSTPTQVEAMQNLRLMRESSNHRRQILMADAETLLAMDRPVAHENGLLLRNPEHPDAEPVAPSLMYLLSTEGRLLTPDQMDASRPAPTTEMIIFATPQEYEKLAARDTDAHAQRVITADFGLDLQFFTSGWRVWGPGSPNEDPMVKQALTRGGPSALEEMVFPSLSQTLNAMANPENAVEHKVLIVPQELLSMVRRLVYGLYGRDVRGENTHGWNHHNPHFDLNRLSTATSQTTVLNALNHLRMIGDQRRAVLVAELAEVQRHGRIANQTSTGSTSNQAPFMIRDDAENRPMALMGAETPQAPSDLLPHLLYLLETEGQRLQPHDALAANANPTTRPKVGMLLIGTPEQWAAIRRDLTIENRYHLAERFEAVELTVPSRATRENLLVAAVETPAMRSLNYQFNLEGLGAQTGPVSAEGARSLLLSYLVSRVDQLASDFSQDSTTAFLRVMTEWNRVLVEDLDLRTQKRIDRNFMERLLSRVFPVPLNLRTLPANDPLVVLSREDAPLLFQQAGYHGPLELRVEIIRALLAQTRMNPTHSIPSSMILFGDTSTGKTFLFETLCRIQGRKMYDFVNTDNNVDADAIIINVGKLVQNSGGDEDSEVGMMTVDKAIEHVNNFLAQPKGYRGNILFDDLHQAPEAVREKLLIYLRSLLEADRGMVLVRRMGENTPREVPVRNVTLVITVNPKDTEQRKDDAEALIATLSTTNFKVERSFLARFGAVKNLSRLPMGAKGPKLAQDIRSGSRSSFRTNSRLTLVTGGAIRTAVERFPDAHAREFFSTAAAQLLSVGGESANSGQNGNDDGHSVYLVAARSELGSQAQAGGSGYTMRRPYFGGAQLTASGSSLSAAIESHIQESTVPLALTADNSAAMLQFLRVIVDSFRTHALAAVVEGATDNPQLATQNGPARPFLAPLLHGVTANLALNEQLPLAALMLDYQDFGIQVPHHRNEFQSWIAADTHQLRQVFPLRFADQFRTFDALRAFLDHTQEVREAPSRTRVLTNISNELIGVLRSHLGTILQVDNLDSLPAPDEWLRNLDSSNRTERPQQSTVALRAALIEHFFRMLDQLNDRTLTENINSERYGRLNPYSSVRLYLMALDRAMTRLPWGRVTRFMTIALNRATNDPQLGQLPGVQQFLFSNPAALIHPVSHEVVFHRAQNSAAFREWPEEQQVRARTQFDYNCSRLLVQEQE